MQRGGLHDRPWHFAYDPESPLVSRQRGELPVTCPMAACGVHGLVTYDPLLVSCERCRRTVVFRACAVAQALDSETCSLCGGTGFVGDTRCTCDDRYRRPIKVLSPEEAFLFRHELRRGDKTLTSGQDK